MFIFDFVAETVLDQIIDWLYGKIIGFLNDFFRIGRTVWDLTDLLKIIKHSVGL